MLAALVLTYALAAAAAPATYDQRQDGDFNVRADVQNVILLVALPQKMALPGNVLDGFFKSAKPELQDRADILMEAFVEPSTPYKVEIGSGRDADADGRAVEVVIAGRRRQNVEAAAEEEYKLVGATEQCGPDRERDPVTLACRARIAPQTDDTKRKHDVSPDQKIPIPEVVPLA